MKINWYNIKESHSSIRIKKSDIPKAVKALGGRKSDSIKAVLSQYGLNPVFKEDGSIKKIHFVGGDYTESVKVLKKIAPVVKEGSRLIVTTFYRYESVTFEKGHAEVRSITTF